MRKVLVLTDFDSNGSGYRNISAYLFSELAKLGYEIRIIGLMNMGEEHNYPFSIHPANNIEESIAIATNLLQLWTPDVLIVALDLPMQATMYEKLKPFLNRLPSETIQTPRKYIAITPLENGPLCMDWAVPLFNMDGVFFISELGKQEALKVGVKAEHLQIGVDTVSWRPAFPEEKKKLRDGLGIPQDAFVVLTVADNQERKNLWAGMASISMLTHDSMKYKDAIDVSVGTKRIADFPKTNENVRYIIVTREQSPFGWKLRSDAVLLGINQEVQIFERGLPQRDLWALYAISDVYLQTSKAEGLGLPVLDAMCCRIPVTATDTGALHELLTDGRGTLCRSDYTFQDVWGNSRRDMVSIDDVVASLRYLKDAHPDTTDAYEFVKAKTWDIPAHQLDEKIRELYNEPKTETQPQ